MKTDRDAESSAINVSVLILILILLNACTFITQEIGEPIPEKQSELKEREADIGNVIANLGPPDNLTGLSDGIAFLYEYIDIRETQIGLGFEGDLFRWFKFSLANSTGKRQVLVLIFDKDGILTSRRYYNWRENLGKGAGIAFIVGAKSLVDTSHLEQEPGALGWGSNLLKPLPEALNSAQDLDAGLSGFEQRGTTSKVGQRTLEMR